MKEKNPCLFSGCKGYCCCDVPLEATVGERKRLFPYASRLTSLKELKNVPTDVPNVYYVRYRRKHLGNSGFVLVVIVGKCPHLDDEGNCLVHNERSHAARNFQIGNEFCNEIRTEHSLPIMIPKEPVE